MKNNLRPIAPTCLSEISVDKCVPVCASCRVLVVQFRRLMLENHKYLNFRVSGFRI